jgi:hypothetical protein
LTCISASPSRWWAPRAAGRPHYIVCSKKGFGGANEPGPEYALQDKVKEQRLSQVAATELLSKLLQAGDGALAVAQAYVNNLNEEFFHIGSVYMEMAKKEGDTEVASRLEAALRTAMEAKQATLRPEIQLINRLLAEEDGQRRKQHLLAPLAIEIMTMNDRYFFGLLERMTQDVGRQPDGPQKGMLQQRLEDIRKDALERLLDGF